MIEWIITSTVLIVLVVIMRHLLKEKISRKMIYALWLVVAVRLLVPFSVAESSLSVMNLAQDMANDHGEGAQNPRGEGTQNPRDEEDPVKAVTPAPSQYPVTSRPEADGNFMITQQAVRENEGTVSGTAENQLNGVFMNIWIAGVISGIILVGVINVRFYLRLKKSRRRVEAEGLGKLPVYLSGEVLTPCLFGLLHPAVYLNLLPENDVRLNHILAHEYTHYRHLDHIWVLVRLLCLCLHWYNPVVWLAAWQSKQDCELACDEDAIRRLGEENRISYGETLISMIAVGNGLRGCVCAATTMVGSRKSIRERVERIAKQTVHSKWAVIAGLAVVMAAVICTYTGQQRSVSEKQVRRQLVESQGYAPDRKLDFFKADYDRDGHEDAFVVIYEGKEQELREGEIYPADIWYYDGAKNIVSLYESGKHIVYSRDHLRIVELTDKTFFACDQIFGEEYLTRLLGIREGEAVNYLKEVCTNMAYDTTEIHSWTPTGYQTYKGELLSAMGNDVLIRGYSLEVLTDGTYGDETNPTRMNRYLYYDRGEDRLKAYPAYAVSEEDVRRLSNGEETVENIYRLCEEEKANVSLEFARRKDMLHVMAQMYNRGDDESMRLCYTFRMSGENIMEMISLEPGTYEDIEENSRQAVAYARYEDYNEKCRFYEELLDATGSSLVNEGVVFSRYEDIGDRHQDSVRMYHYLLDDRMNPMVRIEEYAVGESDGGYQVLNSDYTIYTQIASGEDFTRVFGENQDFAGGRMVYPDYFRLGIAGELVGIADYGRPDTAAVRFFGLSGGAVTRMVYNPDGTFGLTYQFADQSEIELQMYQTYDGVWLPFGGEYYCDSREINDWYKSLTEEDYEQAISSGQVQEYSWGEHEGKAGLLFCGEFEQIGVRLYYSMNGNALILEQDGERRMFAKYTDIYHSWGPQIFLRDYDGDGDLEIGLICYLGGGTGSYADDFAVIDPENGRYDRLFVLSEAGGQLNDRLTGDYDGGRLTLSVDGKDGREITVDIGAALEKEDDEYLLLSSGSGVIFEADENGNIFVKSSIEVQTRKAAWQEKLDDFYGGEGECPWPDCIRARVRYHGDGTFSLENPEFAKMW